MIDSNKSDYNLIVVAHPDDETLYFSSIIQDEKIPSYVICLTDGNADGFGDRRKIEFEEALTQQKCKGWVWGGLADIYESRLQESEVFRVFETIPFIPKAIYTHGVLGEYMHPHHQDVSYFVHKFWEGRQVFSTAYNSFPDKINQLSLNKYKIKCQALIDTYGEETKRFLNFLPSDAVECFCSVALREVEEIYKFLIGGKNSLNLDLLDKYKWFASFIEKCVTEPSERPF